MGGRKPPKTKASVGRPEAQSAATAALAPGMGMMGMPMMREMMDKLSPDAKKKVEEMKDKMAVMALDHHMAMMKAQIEMMEIVKKDLAK